MSYTAAGILVLLLWMSASPTFPSNAESCVETVRALNEKLNPKIDEAELVSILRTLNRSGNESLPRQFITKSEARAAGWRPGTDLWSCKGLEGKSMGGDIFRNREGKLPDGNRFWREADLDFKGGKRGPKRLLYSRDGLRRVTVDHYKTFVEVPPCQ